MDADGLLFLSSGLKKVIRDFGESQFYGVQEAEAGLERVYMELQTSVVNNTFNKVRGEREKRDGAVVGMANGKVLVFFKKEETKGCLYCEWKKPEESEGLRRSLRDAVRVGAREIRR